mgnify:CR=1 FL=1
MDFLYTKKKELAQSGNPKLLWARLSARYCSVKTLQIWFTIPQKELAKSGKPDRRYSYNPELFSLTTRWSCRYCKSKFEFLHELDEFPDKKTPIISVKIK